MTKRGYYAALEEVGKGGMEITAWLTWFLRATISAMQEAQWVVDTVVQKTSFWQRYQETVLNERQRKVLNRLLDAGEQFIGNMTTRKYVGMTNAARLPPAETWPILSKKEYSKKLPVAEEAQAIFFTWTFNPTLETNNFGCAQATHVCARLFS